LPTLNLDKGLYFKSSGGDPVLVNPGEYVVEAAEKGIQLMPTTGEGKGIVIEAGQTAVEEGLVLSTGNANPDLQHLMVVMPDGIVFETVGSHTGIWPRGFWKKLPKGKCKPWQKCNLKKPISGKSLKDFQKAEHLAATAKTLCKPIKDPQLRGACVRKISSELM